MRNREIKKWHKLSSGLLQSTRVFDLYVQRLKSPISDYEDDFYYIEVVDWVNLIAVTKEKEVILIEQFRFGIHENTLEIPGGMLDSREEDPAAAALRELEEETGYVAKECVSLGYVHPNPAIQTNRCHFFYAEGVVPSSVQNLDPAEDIRVQLVPLSEVPKLIAEHKITHSLVVCAFQKYFAAIGEL